MENVTLLTKPTTSEFRGKEILHYPVHGLQVARSVLRAWGAYNEDITVQQFVDQSVPFDITRLPDDHVGRLVDFYIATHVEGSVRRYTDCSFVSYVMGWSRAMHHSSARNTEQQSHGLQARAGTAYDVVRSNLIHGPRGAHRQSVLGVDDTAHALTVLRQGRRLSIMRVPDALKVFGGNKLTLLREP